MKEGSDGNQFNQYNFKFKTNIMENSILIRNISAEELQEVIRSVIKEELQMVLGRKSETRYLSRNEVAALLKISLPTLHEHTKTGRIKGFRIGTRVQYKLEDNVSNLNEIVISRFARMR